MPANTGFWGGISCLLGRHVRSRGQAHATPEGWISRCSRCAIPMARSHGGGKWQAVKTPKIEKVDAAEKTEEVLAKAIERSRKTGRRNELRAAMINDREVAAERVRGTITSKARAALRDRFAKRSEETKPRRRFSLLRRKARSEEQDIETETPPIV